MTTGLSLRLWDTNEGNAGRCINGNRIRGWNRGVSCVNLVSVLKTPGGWYLIRRSCDWLSLVLTMQFLCLDCFVITLQDLHPSPKIAEIHKSIELAQVMSPNSNARTKLRVRQKFTFRWELVCSEKNNNCVELCSRWSTRKQQMWRGSKEIPPGSPPPKQQSL